MFLPGGRASSNDDAQLSGQRFGAILQGAYTL